MEATTRSKRWRLSNGEKLAIIVDMERRLQQGESLKSIARIHNVQPVQLRKWKQKKVELSQTLKTKKSIHPGRTSAIKHLENAIIGWVLDMRAEGVPLNYNILVVKACQMDEEFRRKSWNQQYDAIRLLCRANCIVRRCKTTTAQRRPQETVDEALQWLTIMRPIVVAPEVDRSFIINMDQTPVFLSMHPNQTLELEGTRSVVIRTTCNSTNRVTCSLAISGNGDKLKPMLIFKGVSTGKIAKYELPTFEEYRELAMVCQPNAWQDTENMLQWIDMVLVPYCQDKAQGVPVIVILDSFTAHDSKAVNARFTELGIRTYAVPGGCTGLVQPVDVGVGKPFKDRVRKMWWNWMLEQSVNDIVFTNATRQQVASWVAKCWREFPEKIVRNSWCKTGFSYFLGDE